MQKHKYLAIAIGLVAGGLWLALVFYTLSAGKNAKVPVTPGAIAARSVRQDSKAPAAAYKAPRAESSTLTHHAPVATPSASVTAPQAAMTSTSMRIHETSSATVHTLGSGIASGGGIATTSGNNNARGISYGGNLLALSASIPLASPGAANATEIASTIPERHSVSRIRKTADDAREPFLNPLGDIEWGWMILLALGYAGLAWRKKYNAHE